MGSTYIGRLNHTKSGIPCKRWESTEFAHSQNTVMNFCRNPNQDPDGPWCYTTNPDVEKESCDVPRCFFWKQKDPIFDHGSKECKVGHRYDGYAGTAATTVSGKTCQRWDSQTPHGHIFNDPALFPDVSLEDVSNHCRNPDESPTGPWCYTTDPGAQRETCPIKHCECKSTETGSEYAGKIYRTRAGRKCQRWDVQSPHKHEYDDASKFPDASLAEAENFCRNPDGEAKGPWCFTAERSERWDFCRVPMCPEGRIPKKKLIRTRVIDNETAETSTIISSSKNKDVTQSPLMNPKNLTSTSSTFNSTTSFALTSMPGGDEHKSNKTDSSSTSIPTFHVGVSEFHTEELSTVEYMEIGGASAILIITLLIYIFGFLLKKQKERIRVTLAGNNG